MNLIHWILFQFFPGAGQTTPVQPTVIIRGSWSAGSPLSGGWASANPIVGKWSE